MHYNQARAPRRRAELVSATACVPLVLAAALAMLPIAAAGQQIYKCKGSAGEVLYQNVPCAGPSKGSLKSEAPIITYQPQPQQFYDVDAQLKLEAIRRELARYQMEDAARLQATREAEADYLRRMHQREREMRQQPESRRLEGTPDGWQRMTATERAAYDQRKAAEAQAATPPKTSPKDDSANDRMITPGRTGWDVKARGQVAAEDVAKQRAREAANGVASSPVAQDRAAPRAAWENEKVLTHDKSGWSQTTRSAAVSAEGEKEYKRERARIEAAAAAKAAATARHRLDQEEEERKRRFLGRCDAGSCSDGKGNEYRKAVGSLNDYNSSDGRRCTRHGNMMSCF